MLKFSHEFLVTHSSKQSLHLASLNMSVSVSGNLPACIELFFCSKLIWLHLIPILRQNRHACYQHHTIINQKYSKIYLDTFLCLYIPTYHMRFEQHPIWHCADYIPCLPHRHVSMSSVYVTKTWQWQIGLWYTNKILRYFKIKSVAWYATLLILIQSFKLIFELSVLDIR